MALIRFTRRSPLSPQEAWRRLTRWERHADHVPLTRITVAAPPGGPGVRVLARTGVGPLAFDDPMDVVRFDPPRDGGTGVCRLEKRGTVVTGWAEIRIGPLGTGCEVEWREDLHVTRLPASFDRVTAWCGRRLFGRTVDGLLGRP